MVLPRRSAGLWIFWLDFATTDTGYCWYQAATYTIGNPWARASNTWSPETTPNWIWFAPTNAVISVSIE